jgi:hypothetical protein
MKRKRKAIIVSLLILILLATGKFIFSRFSSGEKSLRRAQDTFQTGGKTPGDPANGIKSLKEFNYIYKKYVEITGNRSPRINDVLQDATKNPEKYGFPSRDSLMSAISNPDNKFSDNDMARKFPKAVFLREPNDFGCSSSQRYVVASNDTYLHRNIKQTGEEKSTMNPVGFYQVLWSDGVTEDVPYDKVLYVPNGKNKYKEAFPGQCGLPDGTLTYDQYWTQIAHFQSPPKGSVGEKGVDFSGKKY